MTLTPVHGSADVIAEHVEADQRYRISRTPTHGYLVTARSRDLVGAIVVAEWLHRTEIAARACMAAVIAGQSAFRAIGIGSAEDAMLRFQAATDEHNAVCERLADSPLVGAEVRDLRKALER